MAMKALVMDFPHPDFIALKKSAEHGVHKALVGRLVTCNKITKE
jgi:hypothetical protein